MSLTPYSPLTCKSVMGGITERVWNDFLPSLACVAGYIVPYANFALFVGVLIYNRYSGEERYGPEDLKEKEIYILRNNEKQFALFIGAGVISAIAELIIFGCIAPFTYIPTIALGLIFTAITFYSESQIVPEEEAQPT